MNVHVVVSVVQGVPAGVRAYFDSNMAERAEQDAKEELGITPGAEAESEDAVELFYNVPVF